MTVREEGRGIGDLLGDLGRQVSTLVRREIDLAKVEITSGVGRLGRGAAMSGVGGVLVYAGLLFLLAAIAFALIDAGLDAWMATGIVGLVVLVIGGIVTSMGVNQIREANPAPTQTAETVKENVDYLKEQVK
jgi:xanthine/uracil permease